MQGRVARGCAFDRYFIQSIVAAGRKPMSVYSQARATSSKTSLSFPLNDGHLYRLYIGHSIQLNSCVYTTRRMHHAFSLLSPSLPHLLFFPYTLKFSFYSCIPFLHIYTSFYFSTRHTLFSFCSTLLLLHF